MGRPQARAPLDGVDGGKSDAGDQRRDRRCPQARGGALTMSGFSQRAKPQKFRDKVKARQFVITAEITPPVSCAREDLVAPARPFVGCADAGNVTDGAGAQPHISALCAASLLAAAGVEAVAQLLRR